MPRPRVLLLEDDPALMELLGELFADEDLDVTRCDDLAGLWGAVRNHPHAIGVAD